MSYSYVVTSQKPTAVHASCVCHFTSASDRNLVIAKGNHLEIHTVRENGLVSEFDVPLFGKITALDFYRPAGAALDVIFVLTEKKHFTVLGYDAANRKLMPRTTGNLKDRVGRDIESGQRGFVDPDQRVIATLLYEGLLKVIPIEATGLKDAFNLRLEMLRFLDLTFLYGCARPTLVMLYEDSRQCRHLKTYVVDLRDHELVPGPWSQSNVEPGARMLIPVPGPTHGVIVVGDTTVTYLGGGTNVVQSVVIPHTQIVAYAPIGDDGSRYLLGDYRGALHVLVLTRDSGRVVGIVMDLLGHTTVAETLSYLDKGVVFVGSTFGDSQLVKLQTAPDEHGSHVEVLDLPSTSCVSRPYVCVLPNAPIHPYTQVLDRYLNIGPVIDMVVVASERQGQCQLVTCSGYGKDGSLRVVRSGIGIHEQASIEIPGIKGLWSLRTSLTSAFDKYLVQAFIGQTRVLAIESEEMSEAEIEGFASDQQTLYCGNLRGDLLVQVRLVAPPGSAVLWCPSPHIQAH